MIPTNLKLNTAKVKKGGSTNNGQLAVLNYIFTNFGHGRSRNSASFPVQAIIFRISP